jgi:hypothetical protein
MGRHDGCGQPGFIGGGCPGEGWLWPSREYVDGGVPGGDGPVECLDWVGWK